MTQLLDRRPGYLSIDLYLDDRPAMMEADVQDLPFSDKQFDLVLCCHVLEHVEDDRRAMSELKRVGKQVVMQHPIYYDRDATFEDPAIVSAEDRLRAYGQEDHVRIYGPDFADRLRVAGFDFAVIPSETPEAAVRRDEIFDCR